MSNNPYSPTHKNVLSFLFNKLDKGYKYGIMKERKGDGKAPNGS